MGKVFNMVVEGTGIGVITFDVVGDTMNTWTDEAFRSFEELLTELESAKGIRGIVFISGKPENFLAGANLKLISQIETADGVDKTMEHFHNSFNRLAALPIPSVAAIHGHCLGGGLEFALVCKGRIAREGRTTLIGLPEINVGLFPGAGGTQRLPRLIGYPAIELILKGTMLPAAKAHELGIVDRLIPAESDLLSAAKSFLEEIIAGKADLKRPVQDFSQLDAVVEQAKAGILKATRGRELPAPLLALKSIHDGLKVSLAEGLAIERRNFVEVVLSKEAKGSINTFFLKGMTDKPKTMMTKGFVPKPTQAGGRPRLRDDGAGDRHRDAPEHPLPRPGQGYPRGPGAGARIRPEDPRRDGREEAPDGTRGCDHDPPHDDIGVRRRLPGSGHRHRGGVRRDRRQEAGLRGALQGRPRRLHRGEQHLLDPHHLDGPLRDETRALRGYPLLLPRLADAARGGDPGRKDRQETIDNLLNFAALIKKRPIVCRDNAGFVVNAMLFPEMIEAFRYIEEGNPIEKVDRAMTRFGMPVGPIRLTDEVGIDIPYKVFVGMGIKQETLKNVVEAGRLGLKKSGKGFFLKDGSVDPEVLPLIMKRPPHELSEEQIQMGLLTAMVKVGKDILDRRIVDDVRMIDVGIIWGLGFPADKGGPMKWADLIGLSKKLYGKNFYPA